MLRSYLWGKDLSGNFTGAGGVGGLLFIKIETGLDATNAGTYFPACDGNGNVLSLTKAADGTQAASYEYSPFGELLRTTGPAAKFNVIRFSTKYEDLETGLHYYGYRFYSAQMKRWLNRDPLGERGGLNLHGTVGNDAINQVDVLGWFVFGPGTDGWGDDPSAPKGPTSEIEEGGQTYTRVNKCNVIIFLGHNGLVPQGEIPCDSCSACTNISCGPSGSKRLNPGKPETPIPGITPYNDVSGDKLDIRDGRAWARDAFEAGVKHAKNTICKDSKRCCEYVTVKVECRFRWYETDPVECNLKTVVRCADYR